MRAARRAGNNPASRYFPRNGRRAEICSSRSTPSQRPIFYKAKGCAQCINTGFTGRRGIYELTAHRRRRRPAHPAQGRRAGHQARRAGQGMDTLRDDGARKVLAGHDHGGGGPRRHAGGRRRRDRDRPRAGQRRAAVAAGRSEPWPSSSTEASSSTSGKQVHGVRDADNAKVLRAVLKREGILLTSAREEVKARAGGRKGGGGAARSSTASSVDDVAMMTRQLATLVSAGIPLVESVGALIEQVEKLRAQARAHAGGRPAQRGQLARQGARGAPAASSRTCT